MAQAAAIAQTSNELANAIDAVVDMQNYRPEASEPGSIAVHNEMLMMFRTQRDEMNALFHEWLDRIASVHAQQLNEQERLLAAADGSMVAIAAPPGLSIIARGQDDGNMDYDPEWTVGELTTPRRRRPDTEKSSCWPSASFNMQGILPSNYDPQAHMYLPVGCRPGSSMADYLDVPLLSEGADVAPSAWEAAAPAQEDPYDILVPVDDLPYKPAGIDELFPTPQLENRCQSAMGFNKDAQAHLAPSPPATLLTIGSESSAKAAASPLTSLVDIYNPSMVLATASTATEAAAAAAQQATGAKAAAKPGPEPGPPLPGELPPPEGDRAAEAATAAAAKQSDEQHLLGSSAAAQASPLSSELAPGSEGGAFSDPTSPTSPISPGVASDIAKQKRRRSDDSGGGGVSGTRTSMVADKTVSDKSMKTCRTEEKKSWFSRTPSRTTFHLNIDAKRKKSGVNKLRMGKVKDQLSHDDLPLGLKKLQLPCRKFINTHFFTGMCSLVIFLNSAHVGYEEEQQLKQALYNLPSDSEAQKLIESLFFAYFAAELAIRIFAEPLTFILGPDWTWNAFDAALVANAAIEYALQNASIPNIAVVRVLRICRMFRILRVVRVLRFFRTLRLMVASIISSFIPLLWVFVLILFVMYVWSILFLHGFKEFIDGGRATSQQIQELEELFGTIPQSLLSLFMVVSGGRDWIEVYMPLAYIHTAYGVIFVVYVFFVVFGLLNVVTSAFVDILTHVSKADLDVVIEEETKLATHHAASVAMLFEAADTDNSKTLSYQEMEEHMKDARMQAYLNSLDIDPEQSKALFTLLDVDESGEVGMEEFIRGCRRLKGTARSIDVNMLLHINEKLLDEFANHRLYTEAKLARLASLCGDPNPQSAPGTPSPVLKKELRRGSTTSVDDAEMKNESSLPHSAAATTTRLTKAADVLERVNRLSTRAFH
eukprot:TRINITY_DN1486_c0_g1_i1.p1 TRINITY_DN1486_c0_g1~~TRINITY_DN1486_c0_g1_i1.p1  ORF type:complete len:938 (+),score=221.51 TRINITY_DN1486_c0_g1_i1:230-3043(+)